MEVTFGPTEFLKAIAEDIEQVADKLGLIDVYQPLTIVYDSETELRRIISDIREKISNTKVTTIAGTTVISTTTDESK